MYYIYIHIYIYMHNRKSDYIITCIYIYTWLSGILDPLVELVFVTIVFQSIQRFDHFVVLRFASNCMSDFFKMS